MSRELVEEIEARWPAEFDATRRHRLRLGDEIELNFFYHHYLRVQQFPVVPMPPSRARFFYAQRCATPNGELNCARALSGRHVDFATYNDDATSEQELRKGLDPLHRMLKVRYGSFA